MDLALNGFQFLDKSLGHLLHRRIRFGPNLGHGRPLDGRIAGKRGANATQMASRLDMVSLPFHDAGPMRRLPRLFLSFDEASWNRLPLPPPRAERGLIGHVGRFRPRVHAQACPDATEKPGHAPNFTNPIVIRYRNGPLIAQAQSVQVIRSMIEFIGDGSLTARWRRWTN